MAQAGFAADTPIPVRLRPTCTLRVAPRRTAAKGAPARLPLSEPCRCCRDTPTNAEEYAEYCSSKKRFCAPGRLGIGKMVSDCRHSPAAFVTLAAARLFARRKQNRAWFAVSRRFTAKSGAAGASTAPIVRNNRVNRPRPAQLAVAQKGDRTGELWQRQTRPKQGFVAGFRTVGAKG